MGEYRSAKLIIVVEGIIDGEVFGKIRIPGGPVDVETIESLIKDTIGRKEWRVETKERRLVGSAKNLVSEVTQRLNENGFNAIGIQDEDLVSVTRFIRGHKFESSCVRLFLQHSHRLIWRIFCILFYQIRINLVD